MRRAHDAQAWHFAMVAAFDGERRACAACVTCASRLPKPVCSRRHAARGLTDSVTAADEPCVDGVVRAARRDVCGHAFVGRSFISRFPCRRLPRRYAVSLYDPFGLFLVPAFFRCGAPRDRADRFACRAGTVLAECAVLRPHFAAGRRGAALPCVVACVARYGERQSIILLKTLYKADFLCYTDCAKQIS